jgi:hypothetical protein
VLLAGAEPTPDQWHGRSIHPGRRLGEVQRTRFRVGRVETAPPGPVLPAPL